MTDLTVSVLMATKNRPDHVRGAVESILNQDYPVQLIVKDGSDYGAWATLPSEVTHVMGADDGIADAINRASVFATGDVLHIAQDDNTMLPGTITSAVEALDGEQVTWTAGCMLVEDETGTQRRQCPEPWSAERMTSVGNLLSEPTVFFRADAFRDVGGMDTAWRFCQDYELWGRLGAKYGAPVYRDHDDSLYRLWPGCISRKHEPVMWEETYAIMDRWQRYGFGVR